MKTIKISIIGATGYTGLELVRLLYNHPNAKIIAMCSRKNIGTKVSLEFPNLLGFIDLKFIAPDDNILFESDIIFFATPHGVAMNSVRQYLDKGIKIIDLGADFRIKDDKLWSEWYGLEHTATDLLESCVYGLPEIYSQQIKVAKLIANPGCYPTAILLALQPLLKNQVIDPKAIIADCKSGVSGAGRAANFSLCEVSENLKPYAVNFHRHKPETTQEMDNLFGAKTQLIFTPHLVPMMRGMLATIYVDLTQEIDIKELYSCYDDSPFVHVIDEIPQTKFVKGTNNCHIHIKKFGNKLIIMSVIDNLSKGASGQAVQNMNLMFGFEQTAGLNNIAFNP